MNKKILFFSTLIALFLTGCMDLTAPTIAYQDTKYKFASFQEVDTQFNFTIKNDNMVPLNGKIDYTLNLNGEDLFSGTSSGIEVGSQDLAIFSLDSRVNLPKVFGTVTSMLKDIDSGKKAIPFKLSGKFKTSVAGVPLETPVKAEGEIPLPALPKIILSGITVDKLDLQGANLKIKTHLQNTNAFPVNFDSFNYQLENKGQPFLQSSSSTKIQLAPSGEQDLVLNVRVDFSKVDKTLITKLMNNTLAADLKKEFGEIY